MRLVVTVVAVVVVVATYLTWLAGRLDRLHARTEAARASLDAQLVRRAAAAEGLAVTALVSDLLPADRAARLDAAAAAALAAPAGAREAVENDLSRALHSSLAGTRLDVLSADPACGPLLAALEAAATKVVLARRFYNDAVTDTLRVRRRRLVRALHLAGYVPIPAYFEIDDRRPGDLAGSELRGQL